MIPANDNPDCTVHDGSCCGRTTQIDGVWLCTFHRMLNDMRELPCTEAHDLFETREEAIEWLEASFDRADPDSMRIEDVDRPRICSACTLRAEKDD
jgi:hypothetical protein